MKKILPYVFLITIIFSGCSGHLTKQQHQTLIEILEILSQTIAEAENILSKSTDPTNQYIDILDKLKIMKDIISEVKAGNAKYDDKLIEKYSRKIKEIEANIKNALDKVFSGDVFFGLGKYKVSDLSDEGKKSLEKFTKTIIQSQVKAFKKLFPNQNLVIIIKAIGYADETPLGAELSETLIQEITPPIPKNAIERKKAFNKKLSFLRAKAIFEYIKLELKKIHDLENITIGIPEIKGFGEEFPFSEQSLDPPYEPQDKRRRICKIYSTITIDSP